MKRSEYIGKDGTLVVFRFGNGTYLVRVINEEDRNVGQAESEFIT
jgi:hypothetical protein